MRPDSALVGLQRLEVGILVVPVVIDAIASFLGLSPVAVQSVGAVVSTRFTTRLISWVYGIAVPVMAIYFIGFTHLQWQSAPSVIALCVTASQLASDPALFASALSRPQMLMSFATWRVGMFLSNVLLSWLFQTPRPSPPDGPYDVGVDSETFDDGTLQVTVNIFYPIDKLGTQDHTFQNINDGCLRIIGERLGISSIFLMYLLDTTSHASPFDKISTAKKHWPLILHSHDITTTASCNVSYCEKLCADGAIVVSVNHGPQDQQIWRQHDSKVTKRRFLLSRLRQLDFIIKELRSRSRTQGRLVEPRIDWSMVTGSGVGIGASAILGHCIRQLATQPNNPPTFHVLCLIAPCLEGFLFSELSPRVSSSMKSFFSLTSDNESATDGDKALPNVTMIHLPQQVLVVALDKTKPGPVGRMLTRRWLRSLPAPDERRRARNAAMLVKLLYMRPKSSLNVFFHVHRSTAVDLSDCSLAAPFILRRAGLTGARGANRTNMMIAQAVSNLVHQEYSRNLLQHCPRKAKASGGDATETFKPLMAPAGSIRLPSRRDLSPTATAVLMALEMLDVLPYKPGNLNDDWRALATELLMTANGQEKLTRRAQSFLTEGLLLYTDRADGTCNPDLPACIDNCGAWTSVEF